MMLRTTVWVHTVLLCASIAVIAADQAAAQGSKQRDRKDEQKENERVKDAEKDVREAKQKVNAAQKQYRESAAQVDSLRRKRDSAQQEWKRKHEEAEERLLDASGIPAVLREMRETRALLNAASKPITDAFMAGGAWKNAEAAAEAAKKKKAALTDGESDGELTDEKMLADELDRLDAVIELPQKLLADQLNTNPEVRTLNDKMSALQKRNEALRAKLGPSPADKEPEVKLAAQALAELEKKLAAAVKELAADRAQLLKSQAAANSASQKLNKAQAADRNDDNKPKNKK